MGAEAPLNLSNCELTCNRADLRGSVESQPASGSLALGFVYAGTPEGAYPLSAVLMKPKKLAEMMPGFLLIRFITHGLCLS